MKVLWLSHFVPYPPAGGSLQRSYYLLRHVARQHEVHVLALRQPRLLGAGAPLDEAVTALSTFCASVRVFSIPAERSAVHRLATMARSVISPPPFDTLWLHSPEMARAVDEWRARADIDLIQVETEGLWQYVEDWPHPRIVLDHHNVESALGDRRAGHERSPWKAALLRRDAAKLRALERRVAHRAAINIVVSPLDAKTLASVSPTASIQVVDNGVDSDYWAPAPGDDGGDPQTLAFAGTLGWFPNRDAIEFFLGEIWPSLLAGNANHRVILIGRDAPPAARVASAADPRVEVTGFVPDVRPYVQRAGIYVCPIRVGGGTRLKVLDALAMAKPLVSTSIGVEGLELADGEHYLRADTATEFVQQIQRLEKDPQLRKRLGHAGRRIVAERYDWRVIGDKLDRAYERTGVQRAPHGAAR